MSTDSALEAFCQPPITCSHCDEPGDLDTASLTDGRGASVVLLCGRCRTLLEHRRCGLCGAPEIGAGHELVPSEAGAASAPVCRGCREQIMGDRR
jgi:hypothetical protein